MELVDALDSFAHCCSPGTLIVSYKVVTGNSNSLNGPSNPALLQLAPVDLARAASFRLLCVVARKVDFGWVAGVLEKTAEANKREGRRCGREYRDLNR